MFKTTKLIIQKQRKSAPQHDYKHVRDDKTKTTDTTKSLVIGLGRFFCTGSKYGASTRSTILVFFYLQIEIIALYPKIKVAF